MKIVVAIDSFKGSLTAMQACEIVAEAIRSEAPHTEVVTKPMADGGEGTGSVLMAATGGQWIGQTVMGPVPEVQVEAGFVWLAEDRTAVVEMATAAGLQLLQPDQRDPLRTTTYGVGQLIKSAVEHGATRILLTIGGSATVDGGVGAATALGWRFLDEGGKEIGLGGGELPRIATILAPVRRAPARASLRRSCVPARPALDERERSSHEDANVAVEVLCDVDNPLCGEQGAARAYGPQKGATPEMVEVLDSALSHLANLVKEQLGRDITDIPGAGAAGGLAAGAIAFMDAQLVCGIDAIMAQTHLPEAVVGADWVITGEGSFDKQSLRGKVVSGVTRVGKGAGARVAVLAGQVRLPRDMYRQAGIETAVSCMEDGMDLEYAVAHGSRLLDRAARRFVRDNVQAGQTRR